MLLETRAELKRLVEEEVQDMSFKEEVVKDMRKWHGSDIYYTID